MTNAHVVWPFNGVRVTFPDGTEFLDAPVLNSDLMGDLAVIGPLQTNLESVALVDGEHLATGSDLYLIGYPAEVEDFPQPSMTRGILSRLREWEPIGITYFQTDAAAAGGQSGGVLASGDGHVIGISGLVYSEVRFGIVASAADVLKRVQGIIDGQDVSKLGARQLSRENGKLSLGVSLENVWESRPFIVEEPAKTELKIEVEGRNDVKILLRDRFGNEVIFADDCSIGVESGTAETVLGAPYFLIITQNSENPGDFRLKSNVPLYPYNDPDDGISASVGQTIRANMDYPLDFDYFLIDLTEGQTIEITVDSTNFDPFVQVDYLGASNQQVVSDDDSGGGIFGTNAKITYLAPHTGSYFVVVNDASGGSGLGGYLLTIATAVGAAGLVGSLPSEPVTEPQISAYDDAIKENPQSGKVYAFRGLAYFVQGEYMRSLEDFEEAIRLSPDCPDHYTYRGNAQLALQQYQKAIADFDEALLIYPDFSRARSGRGLAYLRLSRYEKSIEEFDLAIDLDPENADAFFGRSLAYIMLGRDTDSKKDSKQAMELGMDRAVLDAATIEFTKKRDALLATPEPPLAASTPTGSSDSYYKGGEAYFKEGRYQQAVDQFTLAIKVNPGYVGAYWYRASAYDRLGQFHRAIEDYSEAIRLDPENAYLFSDRGLSYASLGQYRQAIADYDEAIRLDQQNPAAYNNRGGAYIGLAQYARAIQDLDEAIRLNPEFAGSWTWRAIAYRSLGQYTRAIQDHNEAIRLDPETGEFVFHRALTYTFLSNDVLAEQDIERALILGVDKARLERDIEWAKSQR